MMVVSNFSQRFAKQLGDNPVPVLATLILLSYTKILRTLISVLYVTYLEYPTHDRRCGCTMETLTILVANASHFSSGSVCLSLPFSSIHSCFFFFSGCRLYHTSGSFHGSTVPGWNLSWCIPCSLQSKTSLLAWTAVCVITLCSSFCACLSIQFSAW